MRLSKRKAALLVITENIEMELFASEEACMVTLTQEEEEEDSFDQRHLEHPLVPDSEDEAEPQLQTPPRQLPKPKTQSPAKVEAEHCPPVLEFMEDIEIEMEVFHPLRASEIELMEIKSDHSSIMTLRSPNGAGRLKWKRLTPQKTGLVVKDVVCLPSGHYLAQLERHTVPRGKERAALAAMGMTARITIDYGWSANQMESRLAALFRGRFAKRAGQRFSFTYLQCVPGSRVLFVPEAPAEGWTGEQVLGTSGHGALYILSHQDYPQAESEKSASETHVVNRREFCLEASTESCPDEDNQQGRQTCVPSTTEEFPLDLDSILRLFRQENMDRDVETHIQVRRRDLLRSALKVVRRPDFCFRTTPIVSFSGEETDGHDGPLREFFRLTLLELQQSSIFEGPPGRLFLTYDLAALEDRKYYKAGVLIGWSLAQGGPGPRCLHPALYQLMCGQNPSLEGFSWGDIVDAEAQIRLQQLQSCTDVKLLSPGLCDWVSSCGIPGIYSAHSDDTPSIYIRLVKHYIYHRVASMISQFTEGLNSCGGLWDTVLSHWREFMPVMTSAQQQPLTLEQFKQLFTVCYSQQDSQLRAAEAATAGHWETVLTLVSDGQTDFSFEDLLAFITGADHLPPLGFTTSISLCFYSQDTSTSCVRLPHASTCTLELFLPRGAAGATDLSALLSRSVHEALGFTRYQSQGDGEDSCINAVINI
ncbi:G2/M phase-specific E3 ubiquitin-protein ligase-like [Plectropomus leopardus]|uniref:G2/M phase-specific E3 ubiquitin-protein ligase-like n=1 Tax=Plectropomus leopardus TaxID=160734 RepID=UPI001C4D8D2C|nr:G2/M phase-specific E3 ubiquitin-protein ligase-like [Plectropomus leopardus]